MSILDIGLLTGFSVNTNDLDLVRVLTHTQMHGCLMHVLVRSCLKVALASFLNTR